MGTNWGAIRPVLKSLIASLTGLDARWEDQPDAYTDSVTRGVCELKIAAPQSVGWDQVTITEDLTKAQGSELQDRVDGQRTFILKVKCKSYEQGDSSTAYSYLETLRNRMSFRSTADVLHTVNIAWIADKSIVDLGTTTEGAQDDRIVSVASLDLKMRMVVFETDPTRYGYIETINGGAGPSYTP